MIKEYDYKGQKIKVKIDRGKRLSDVGDKCPDCEKYCLHYDPKIITMVPIMKCSNCGATFNARIEEVQE